jgi:hypothetical protein
VSALSRSESVPAERIFWKNVYSEEEGVGIEEEELEWEEDWYVETEEVCKEVA